MKVFRKFLISLGLGTAACSATSSEVATKEVADQAGIVRFNLPEGWVEEIEPEGGVMFYGTEEDAGTLRSTVITASSPTDIASDEPIDLLKGVSGVDPTTIVLLANGNAIGSSVTHSSENGTPITLFWWYLTNAVPPRHIRLATFSYTVLTEDENTERTVDEVKMLEQSIRDARFNPVLGEMGTVH